jgi:hypothetical protein
MKASWFRFVGTSLLIGALAVPAIAAAPAKKNLRTRDLVGSVSAVNATANTITLQVKIGILTASATLVADPTAEIIRHSIAGLSSLKAGDTLQVVGLPLSISAKALSAGNLLNSQTSDQTGSASGSGGSAATGTAASAPKPIGGAYAQGVIKSIDAASGQILLNLADGTPVTVTAATDIALSRIDQVTAAGVQVGDLAHVRVSIDSAGNLHILSMELQAAKPTATTGGTTGGGSSNGGATNNGQVGTEPVPTPD